MSSYVEKEFAISSELSNTEEILDISEELSTFLFLAGAHGVVTSPSNTLLGYFSTELEEKTLLDLKIKGLSLLSSRTILLGEFAESLNFPSRVIGALTIQPQAAITEPVKENKSFEAGLIRIIPGEGFGTGEHTSTASVLKLMQAPEISYSSIKRFLDVGSGSGILSIAALKLFPQCEVIAIEHDECANNNAKDNFHLNDISSRITLISEDIFSHKLIGTFDIIVANVYAESLVELSDTFYNALSSYGFLILAGILEEKRDDLLKAYLPSYWNYIHKEVNLGWAAFLLQRK